MEKTILRLNKEFSIMLLSIICILFVCLNGGSNTSNLFSFLLSLLKALMFFTTPFAVYVLEKNNAELKKVASIYASYFLINFVIVIVSFINLLIPDFWLGILDLINLIVLLSCVFIFIEQLMIYNDIGSKVYSNTIIRLVYWLGNFVSYPLLYFINKRNSKDKKV